MKPITPALYRAFNWSFWLSIASAVGIIWLASTEPPHAPPTLTGVVLVSLACAAGVAWYITLGRIAHDLGRRWIVWTGLAFITAPIGPLVIYPLMLGHIKAALAAAQPAPSAPK